MQAATESRSPIRSLLSVQLLALLPVLLLWWRTPNLSVISALLIQVLSALVLSRWVFRQRGWWLIIHAVFLPSALLLLQLQLPPWLYFLALLLCLLVFGHAWSGRVPLFISSVAAREALDEFLPQGDDLRFLDLGCGTGAVVRAVKAMRPGWQCHGIEAAWWPYMLARWRSRQQPEVVIRRGDFWREDLGQYDVVYAYLSPTPMPKLWRKLLVQMPRGVFISYRFGIPGAVPSRQLELPDGSHLYLWQRGEGA